MSTITADRIVPRYSTVTTIPGIKCPDPVDGSDLVNLDTLTAYLADPTTHAFTESSISETISGAAAAVTMTGVIQRVGNLVTLVWDQLTFTGAAEWLSSGNMFIDAGLSELLPAQNVSTYVHFTYDGGVYIAQMVLTSAGGFTLYSDRIQSGFPPGECILREGSMTWPFNNVV